MSNFFCSNHSPILYLRGSPEFDNFNNTFRSIRSTVTVLSHDVCDEKLQFKNFSHKWKSKPTVMNLLQVRASIPINNSTVPSNAIPSQITHHATIRLAPRGPNIAHRIDDWWITINFYMFAYRCKFFNHERIPLQYDSNVRLYGNEK